MDDFIQEYDNKYLKKIKESVMKFFEVIEMWPKYKESAEKVVKMISTDLLIGLMKTRPQNEIETFKKEMEESNLTQFIEEINSKFTDEEVEAQTLKSIKKVLLNRVEQIKSSLLPGAYEKLEQLVNSLT